MKFITFFSKDKLRAWITRHAEGPQGAIALSSVSFAESVFFPIPPDVLLIAIIAVRKAERWFWYATLTTVFSILGAIVGYVIGATLFDTFGAKVIDLYHLEDEFEKISVIFQEQTFSAILVAAITPIPYKIFTLAGGLFKVNFAIFILASIIGRGLRFYLVAYLTKLYGPRLVEVFFKYFNTISLVLVIVIVLVFHFVL